MEKTKKEEKTKMENIVRHRLFAKSGVAVRVFNLYTTDCCYTLDDGSSNALGCGTISDMELLLESKTQELLADGWNIDSDFDAANGGYQLWRK